MKQYKVKGIKPEYKTHSKKKTEADKFFERMLKKQYEDMYLAETLIDNLIEKEIGRAHV